MATLNDITYCVYAFRMIGYVDLECHLAEIGNPCPLPQQRCDFLPQIG